MSKPEISLYFSVKSFASDILSNNFGLIFLFPIKDLKSVFSSLVGMYNVGLNFDFQNVGAAEVLSSTTGKLVLEGLSNFKGSISDGERQFVKDINPGLNMSKEGISANIALQKKGNDITLKYNEEANDWVERNGGLSKKDKISNQSWSEFTSKFHKENPLISDDERKTLSSLSKNYDQEFLEGNNVKTINGKKYIKIGDQIYEL